MMVLMVTKHRKSLLQVEIIINEKQHKIWMEFVLLVARSMGVGHAIKRQELVLVVKNRDIWFEIVQRVRSFYLGNLRRRIKKIAKSLGLKDEYLL